MYFQTKLTEIELEDIIYFQRYQDIQESGLSVYDHLSWDNSKVLRQLSLGSYGRPDLVGINFQGDSETLKEVCITIYELKSGEVSFEALCQIMKYQYALRKLFSENQKCKGIDIHISTCLIGHTVNNSVDFMAA
ncbi:MAG TPA: hypothetical protein VGN64_14305, partial [Dyadobacter sp.]|nr:hypothetical protein [Dyadobacter sp.]